MRQRCEEYWLIPLSENIGKWKIAPLMCSVKGSVESAREETLILCISQLKASTSTPRPNPGKFSVVVKALLRGKNFLQKHSLWGKAVPTPGEYFRRSIKTLNVENWDFYRDKTLILDLGVSSTTLWSYPLT